MPTSTPVRFHLPAVGMPSRRMGKYGEFHDTSETEEEPDEGTESETDAEGETPDYEALYRASEQRIKTLNAESKGHRLKAKEYAKKLREASGEDDGFETKQAQEERDALRIENAVLKAAMQHGVDPDLLELKLKKAGHLKLDEEGDLPVEFEEAAEQIAGKMVSAGRDAGPRPPKSPQLGGRKPTGSRDADLEALKKRYPALMHGRG